MEPGKKALDKQMEIDGVALKKAGTAFRLNASLNKKKKTEKKEGLKL